MVSLQRARDAYQSLGATALLKRAVEAAYWQVRNTQTITVDGTTALFVAENRTVVYQDRKRIRDEEAVLERVLRAIEPGDVFFDIGANTGIYSIFAGLREPESEVCAFEPHQSSLNVLRKNLQHNGLNNVETYCLPLSDTDGLVQFELPKSSTPSHGTGAIETDSSQGGVALPTKPGDELIRSGALPAPNIVKIDVEGAEKLVIEGLSETLADEQCRVVYCEVHEPSEVSRPSVDDFGSSVSDIESRLHSFGFKTERLASADRRTPLFASKPESSGEGYPRDHWSDQSRST